MRYIDWNIKAGNKAEEFYEYLNSKMEKESCIVTLQEVKPNCARTIREKFGSNYNIVYSIDYRPVGEFDSGNRELGVMIITSKDIEIESQGVFDRTILPERTLYANLKIANKKYRIVTFHAVTGSGFLYGKAVQYRSMAECIKEFKPDFVSMDANEPKVDALDIEEMEFFSQGPGDEGDKNGARIFFRELIKLGLDDSYKKVKTGNTNTQPLKVSHVIKDAKGNAKRECRYDFIFLTDCVKVQTVDYLYDESTRPGLSDHAMVVANVEM